MCRAWKTFPVYGGELCPCAADRAGILTWPVQAPSGKLCLALQGALLSQTCKTNDKVHPSVTLGSWQQEGQVPKQTSVVLL